MVLYYYEERFNNLLMMIICCKEHKEHFYNKHSYQGQRQIENIQKREFCQWFENNVSSHVNCPHNFSELNY